MESPSDHLEELELLRQKTRSMIGSSFASYGLSAAAFALVLGSVIFSVSQVAPLERKITEKLNTITDLDGQLAGKRGEIVRLDAALAAKQKELVAKQQDAYAANIVANTLATDLRRETADLPVAGKGTVKTGWAWLGIYGTIGNRWLRGPFNSISKPPQEIKAGDTLVCSDRVYLRSDAPKAPDFNLGKIVAIVKEGTKIKVLQVAHGKKSSWFAQIELSER